MARYGPPSGGSTGSSGKDVRLTGDFHRPSSTSSGRPSHASTTVPALTTTRREYTDGPYKVIEIRDGNNSMRQIRYIPGEKVEYRAAHTFSYTGPHTDTFVKMLIGPDFDVTDFLSGNSQLPFDTTEFQIEGFDPVVRRPTRSGYSGKSNSSDSGCGCGCGCGCLIAIVIACLGARGMVALGEFIVECIAKLFA